MITVATRADGKLRHGCSVCGRGFTWPDGKEHPFGHGCKGGEVVYYVPDGFDFAAYSAERRLKREAANPQPTPPAPAPKKAPCLHRGEAKGTVKVLCQSCGGAKLIDQPAFVCDVYRRCLPSFRPTGEAKDRWFGNAAKGIEPREESAVYHLCQGCEGYSPLVAISEPENSS